MGDYGTHTRHPAGASSSSVLVWTVEDDFDEEPVDLDFVDPLTGAFAERTLILTTRSTSLPHFP